MTAYEVRMSDWSSDVCSSDLGNLWLTWRSRHAFTPRSTARASLSITPKLALPSKTTRTPFLLASASAFTQFAAGSLLASLVPSLLYNLLPWKGPAVPGIAFLILSAASAVTQLSQRNIQPIKGLVLGLLPLADRKDVVEEQS